MTKNYKKLLELLAVCNIQETFNILYDTYNGNLKDMQRMFKDINQVVMIDE